MRHRTNEIQHKLRLLLDTSHVSNPPTGRSRIAIQRQILAEISQLPHVTAVSHISSFMMKPGTRLAAMYCVSSLLARASIPELMIIHRQRGSNPVFRGQPSSNHLAWRNLGTKDLKHVYLPWPLGLLSFHPHYHIRSTIVAELARGQHPSTIAFLLLRANDWISDIRHMATDALRQQLASGRVAPFAMYLPLLQHLRKCQRFEDPSLITDIENTLLREPHQLRIGLTSSHRQVRRACYQLVAQRRYHKHIISNGLKDPETAIQRACAITLLRATAQQSYDISPVTRHKNPGIRKLAAHICASEQLPAAQQIVEGLALDPHKIVRKAAQNELSRRWSYNLRDFYRAKLNALPTSPGAILGLGDTGSPADDRLLAPLAYGEGSSIRCAAIHALRSLSPTKCVKILHDALTDPSPSVRKTANTILLRSNLSINLERLAKIVGSGHIDAGQRALEIMVARGGTRGVIFMMGALRNAPKPVMQNGIQLLVDWFIVASFLPPSEQSSLRNALEKLHGIIPNETLRQLQVKLA